MKKEACSFFAFLCSVTMLHAQGVGRDSVRIINDVVITGTGTYRKSNNAPVSVRVISSKELNDAHVTNLQDALVKLTPNVTTHTNGMGTFMNFNGISDDYVLILENGKKVVGDDRWSRINISNVKRIEVLSGAASSLYGSDAIAGVINIITDDGCSGVSVSERTHVSSKGRLSEDINVSATEGCLTFQTSYNYRTSDNWQVNSYQMFEETDYESGDVVPVLKLTGRPMSTGYVSNDVSEKIQLRLSDKLSLYLRGEFFDNTTKRPQNAKYYTQSKKTVTDDDGNKSYAYTYTQKTAYTYDVHHRSYTYGGGGRLEINKKSHLYLDVYSDNFTSKYHYWQTADEEDYEMTRKRTHYTNENLKGIFRLSASHKLSAGLEFVQSSLNSESDNIDFETSATYNAYLQDEMRIVNGLEAVVGGRYTYNDNFGSHATANASLFYHVGGLRVRLGYAGGYRTPDLSQLYATDQAKTNARYTLNNTSLKPEKSNFVNMNVEYSNRWLSVGVTGYINKVRDMINLRVLSQEEINGDASLTKLYDEGWTTIRQRSNIDDAKIKGVCLNAKVALPEGITVGASYTYTDSEAKSTTFDSKAQTYVTTVSPTDKSVKNVLTTSAAWDHSFGGYNLNVCVNGHMQGRRYSNTYGYAPRCQQWDFNTRHTFYTSQMTIEPSVGVENVFNQRDTSYWNSNFSTINPGRTLYVALALRFKN